MILLLFNISLLLYILCNIYIYNLLFFLDIISTGFAYFITYTNILKYKKKHNIKGYYNIILDKNIELICKEKKKSEKNKIKFNTIKLFILNIFISLSQKIINNYKLFSSVIDNSQHDDKFINDIKNNKIILVGFHYGIYYDYSYLFSKFNYNTLSIIKLKNEFIKNIIFDNNSTKNNIGILNNNFINNIFNDYPINCIICDQHNNRSIKYQFLNNKALFNSYPADIHKITKRSIWCTYSKYDLINKKIIVKIVPIQRKYDNTPKTEIMKKIIDIFDNEIINNPEQYNLLYNKFK